MTEKLVVVWGEGIWTGPGKRDNKEACDVYVHHLDCNNDFMGIWSKHKIVHSKYVQIIVVNYNLTELSKIYSRKGKVFK